MRKSKMKVAMEIAKAVSQRSHDSQTKVGSVLIKNSSGAHIATGFNGFVRNSPDHLLPTTRPEKYKYICHSEENLIYNCARHGIAMNDCTLVCTLSPCVKCMRALYQTGVTRVVVKEFYTDIEEIQGMLDLDIEISETEDGFFELLYKEK